MAHYKNAMEGIVENKYEQMKAQLNCCTCERCRNDIIAYALNQLPSKYVVTPKGEVYSKTYALGMQHDADISSAIAKGSQVVKKYPRH